MFPVWMLTKHSCLLLDFIFSTGSNYVFFSFHYLGGFIIVSAKWSMLICIFKWMYQKWQKNKSFYQLGIERLISLQACGDTHFKSKPSLIYICCYRLFWVAYLRLLCGTKQVLQRSEHKDKKWICSAWRLTANLYMAGTFFFFFFHLLTWFLSNICYHYRRAIYR